MRQVNTGSSMKTSQRWFDRRSKRSADAISGSPYWCMKAFACLSVPSSHPFWSSDELPWPTKLFAPMKALPDPSHIMCRLGNHTFLLSSGQSPHYPMRHGSAKYSKFAYSSAFGFSCSTGDGSLEQVAADSMLALKDNSARAAECDGESWRVRRLPIDATIVGRGTANVHLRSGWKPWPDVEVETWLIPPQTSWPNYYLRVHKLTTSRPLLTSEAGWATYGQGSDGRALVQAFSGETSRGGDEEIGWSRAVTRAGVVGVVDIPVKGGRGDRKGRLVQSDPNSNLIFSRSILPSLAGEVKEGVTWMAVAVFGFPEKEGGNTGWDGQWGRKPEVPAYVFE